MELRALMRRDRSKIDNLVTAAIHAGSIGYYSEAEAHAWEQSHHLDAMLSADHTVVVSDRSSLLAIAGVDAVARYHIRFVFVAPDRWRQGLGRFVVHLLEDFCAANGVTEMNVAAAKNAVGFYETLGYFPEGNVQYLMAAQKDASQVIKVDAVAMSKNVSAF
ncbi:GNAT family N-acetyltransferase [Paraburkholderia sacchari]|uniref:GNAT family N-acetyltransferase n=1 Tax=Paraburkholderia sacchari TaxID=159450 RepID=UPI003D992F91